MDNILRKHIRMIENLSREFFHGSHSNIPIGTIITKNKNYEKIWGGTDFYRILESHRPHDKPSHKNSVFFCDNIEGVEVSGGNIDYIFRIMPLSEFHRFDTQWVHQLLVALDNYGEDSKEVAKFAELYWSSTPSDDPTWEYLCDSIKILELVEDNT